MKPKHTKAGRSSRGNSLRTERSRVDRSREEIIWANTFWETRRRPTLWVDMAGITYSDKNYYIERLGSPDTVSYDLFVLEYVTSGKGYLEALGERAEVSAGDFYLINCKMPHCYYSDGKDPFEKKWINVRGSFLDALCPLILQGKPYVVLPLGERAGQVMDEIHKRIRRTTPADSDQILSFTMKRILDLFLMADRYRTEEMESLPQVEQIVRYIEQNICLDLHVRDLCEHFYISASTLYRHFMAQFGTSPKEFIMQKKIEASKRMIASGESTLQTIATVLHFCDAHHFFRCFKACTGMSPSEYRASLLTNPIGDEAPIQ